jgi:hypothetical protein
MNTSKKYVVVVAGEVISKNDKQRHIITCGQVIALYRVNPRECITINFGEDGDGKLRGYNKNNLIFLYPRYRGDYVLPDGNQIQKWKEELKEIELDG